MSMYNAPLSARSRADEVDDHMGVWEERVHPKNGSTFYYNTVTKVSS